MSESLDKFLFEPHHFALSDEETKGIVVVVGSLSVKIFGLNKKRKGLWKRTIKVYYNFMSTVTYSTFVCRTRLTKSQSVAPSSKREN